jgi:hypothetical protein
LTVHQVTKEQEIQQADQGRPHLFILGAGASIAATYPNGDKNGKKLPSMDNFLELLELNELIDSTGLTFASKNFEDIYSAIHASCEHQEILEELEKRVYSYFYELELPEKPNIYDYLVLSLREKDFIATFNWDPFLAQAILRNQKQFKMPQVLFLHGNVAIGACPNRCSMGFAIGKCPKCGEYYQSSRLLYPVAEKNYQDGELNQNQWESFQDVLDRAMYVTIFGYGAPSSDKSAIELMKQAWGNWKERKLEQVEFINLLPEEELVETWQDFIHSHHFDSVRSDFFESWVAKHPRRSIEAFSNQYLMARFIEDNPLPECSTLEELWAWLKPLKKFEEEK